MGLLLVSMSFAKPGLTEMIDNPWDQAFLVSGPNFPWFFKCFKCLAKQNSLRILRDLQDNIKCYNIWIIGVPEEEDKKKDHEKILEEIIVENFPKMGKEIITQVQETQRVPNRIKPRRNPPRHILITLTKIKHKEQIWKAAREKQQITHKGIAIRITADLSIETLQARREWQDILKMMKENNLQPRLLYPARI